MPRLQSLKPGTRRGTVNPTARWPERLEHLATLLRADALAVVSATSAGPSAIFSYRLSGTVDWLAALGTDVFARAERGAFVTAIPAGRWTDGSSYAVIAPIEAWNGTAIVVGLREDIPFDAIEAFGATAAARLLEMSALEGRALAETLRQSASLEERLHVLSGMGDDLAHTRDPSAMLERATQEVARRMGAQAASIMVVEGDELRLRASVGLPSAAAGVRRRIGEGIAGWVAARGEKVVLHGAVADERFSGVDPEARESIVVPLRDGDDVLGVLNVKRPESAEGFGERHELLDAIAADIGRALRSVRSLDELERDREVAYAYADVARAVAASDTNAALEASLRLGHHAVALRDTKGALIAVRARDGDEECRESAISASTNGGRVGFARHGSTYKEEESALAERTADTLAFLGRELAAELPPQPEPIAGRPAGMRVLAVEDHPVMRLGVRAMLEREGFQVAGTTGSCAEALGVLGEAVADVVLLDLNLPDASGAEAVVRIREAAPSLPIVVFSVDRTPVVIRSVLRAGANGYVTKDAPISRVVAALRAASTGLVVMGPEEAIAAAGSVEPSSRADLPRSDHGGGRGDASGRGEAGRTNGDDGAEGANGEMTHDALTPRELELLRYMAEGYTNKEVARAMVLAEDTVKKAVQTLIAKLGAADRTHAVVLALRGHLID